MTAGSDRRRCRVDRRPVGEAHGSSRDNRVRLGQHAAELPWRPGRSQPEQARQIELAEPAELLEAVNAGGKAWATVRGERWRVRSETAMPAGARMRIVRREGLLLWVAPE